MAGLREGGDAPAVEGSAGRVALLKLKTADFKLISRRRTLPAPIQTARMLFAAVREMLAVEVGGRPTA